MSDVQEVLKEMREMQTAHPVLRLALDSWASRLERALAPAGAVGGGGPGSNTGHGHVWQRPDGVKARCGGPRMCRECARDAAQWPSLWPPAPPSKISPPPPSSLRASPPAAPQGWREVLAWYEAAKDDELWPLGDHHGVPKWKVQRREWDARRAMFDALQGGQRSSP